MTENKEKFVRADRVPTNGEIELALERLSPNWARAAPRPRTGGISYILQSLAHGRSHAVVLEIKRSPVGLVHEGCSAFRAHAKRIERRRKTDKSDQSEH
jgi:hypothetical protein